MQKAGKNYSLKELAKLSGVAERTIRYYIEKELLPPPEGSRNTSVYNGEHLLRLGFIQLLKSDFLPLNEIKVLLQAKSAGELEEIALSNGLFRPGQASAGFTRSEKEPGLAPGKLATVRRQLAGETRPGYDTGQTLYPPRNPAQVAHAAFQGLNMAMYLPDTSTTERSPAQQTGPKSRFGFSPAHFTANQELAGEPLQGNSWEHVKIAPGIELQIHESVLREKNGLVKELTEAIRRVLEK